MGVEPLTLIHQFSPTLNDAIRALFIASDWSNRSFWYSGHAIPIYASCISVIVIIVRALAASPYSNRYFSWLGPLDKRGAETLPPPHTSHVRAHGGRIIFTSEILRLCSCFELLHLSFIRFSANDGTALGAAFVVFAYATLLALFMVFRRRPSAATSHHLTFVLTSLWVVYFVRNVVPFMTYTLHPADSLYMLWELIGVLSLAAVVLPLITPRRYIPFIESDPMTPNPEQTASPLSLILFSFLDATVWKAYRVSHLPLAELPPLADSDHSKNLVRTAFPHLDPYPEDNSETKSSILQLYRRNVRYRSFFWAVMSVFWKETIVIVLLLLSNNIATLLSPYSLKKLLEYMGNGSEGAVVRPWVWIASLFLAPFSATLIMQQYQTRLTRVTVRLEAMLTQLILQHALRIRVVAEVTADAEHVKSHSTTMAPAIPPSEHDNTASTSSAVYTTTSPSTTTPNANAGKSLVGRMNNLISSDMQAIGQGAEFIQVLFAGPLIIFLTVGFLYTILGWRYVLLHGNSSFLMFRKRIGWICKVTPSKRRFRLHIDEELIFRKGSINLIVGPTGSGKTSLLMALLGEMHFIPSGPSSWFNLPRSGGVAYAAQESWVTNATIRENIVFGSSFDEERYNKVIQQCALTRDLELFNAGDHTEVGERGLTLSGGQKARITLARAIYSPAEILLLDDIFAALDVHTAKWIVDKCFSGELIRGRTVLLVAHNINLVAPISDFVVSLGSDGKIISRGTISDALEKSSQLKLEVAKELDVKMKEEETVDSDRVNTQKEAEGKLILEEEVAEGHISWASIKMYVVALGGQHWILFWFVYTTAAYLECSIEVVQPWLLGTWATQYQNHSPEEVNVAFYLTVYVGLVFLMLLVYCCNQLILTFGALRASGSLHRRLIDSILGTTLRWLDKTPTSRVITRVTQDIAAIDITIPNVFAQLFEVLVVITVRFITIMIFTPAVGMLGLLIFFVGGVAGNVYMKSQLSVKREMSKAKSPVMAHFGASVEGLTSIRAYGAQNAVLQKSLNHIDNYTRSSRVFNDLARWIGIRVDALGGWFAASLGWYFVYGPKSNLSTSNSAFVLTMAVGFGRLVLSIVQLFNLFEVNGILERLQEYMVIEQEPKPEKDSSPPAHWPSSGDLRVENLSAKYSHDGPMVLHDISFDLRSGERIGVVGRTGSGKSSLMLSLLRCIPTNGEVFYDGLPTSTLNLNSLRSQVTIIPQVPELLSGTLRRNLDPFDQFDDATLNAALRDAGLYSTQKEDDDSRITLDSSIARSGSNLSVGQRQIIALARAMVRESKLLILDEGLSHSSYYKTDTIIQQSLRNEIKKDVTIITVAHRLQTIMDSDRIMVLDAGRIVEFDSPGKLLEKEAGFFRSLVDESGDREALYGAANH
ncbi:P-loop containing nucleoside triphosphate hydrolase protein [Collybia nuda]|uniref:P-loop containing nucleoside triphosphate hydrolase protein n=1 Tax=Collybia nuda TaxID=64659 RepID=A0A9P5YI63_9AGAR|nr:P-loop containing nucleoside triphosphate hydrolase protein [Collybia nuda]